MALPKFIITMDGVFRLGMVNQHKNQAILALAVGIIISIMPRIVLSSTALRMTSVSRESCCGRLCRSRTNSDDQLYLNHLKCCHKSTGLC